MSSRGLERTFQRARAYPIKHRGKWRIGLCVRGATFQSGWLTIRNILKARALGFAGVTQRPPRLRSHYEEAPVVIERHRQATCHAHRLRARDCAHRNGRRVKGPFIAGMKAPTGHTRTQVSWLVLGLDRQTFHHDNRCLHQRAAESTAGAQTTLPA